MKILGLLLTEVTRNNNNRLFTSLKQSVLNNGCHFIVFEGRSLLSSLYAEKQHNFVYQLADKSLIDHLIVSSASVPPTYDSTEFQRYIANATKSIPITYYAKREACHSIRVNNGLGAKNLVKHLLTEHRLERFVVIRGPIGDDDADERYTSTMGVLREAGCIDKVVEFQSTWFAPEATEIVKKVIQEHLDYDAIIFPNDESAIAALDYINHFEPQLRGHYAIVGFDNSTNAKNISPQLTTADHPHKAMADKVIELINSDVKEPIDAVFSVETVIRASCGCYDAREETKPTFKLYKDGYDLQENIQSLNRTDLFAKLSRTLERKEIRGCYISLYKSEPFSLNENDVVPDYSELIYAFHNGTQISDSVGSIYQTKQLLPKDLLGSDPQCLLVKNLFYSDKHFGFVVFNLTHGRVSDIEGVTSNIATTLHIIYLVKKMQYALKENERIVAKLATDNRNLQDDLTNLQAISNTDELTGALNRRGFHEKLEQQLIHWEQQRVAFIFADMDKLKFINDTFGHEAGDKAIIHVAHALTQSFRYNDIVARLGGDEFIICAQVSSEQQIEHILARIKRGLEAINTSKQFPFTMSISFGYHSLIVDSQLDINAAISYADELLYQEKKLNR